jgi:AcrR family transcriptional regulator
MPPKKLRTSELEQQLLRSAVKIIETGEQPLTARTVAAAAGTSTGALYELFGDKAGLIKAVFHEGFRQCAAQVEALPVTSDARHDIVVLLQITRTFSRTNPMLWKIMFARPFTEFQPTAADYTAATDIYAIVLARVDRLLAEAGSRTTNHMDVARVLIATSRVLIDAELDGILGNSRKSNDRRWHLAIDSLLDGLTMGPTPTRQPKRASQ